MNTKLHLTPLKLLSLFIVSLGVTIPLEAGKWDPLLEMLWKNADVAVEPAVRAVDARIVEQAVLRHGDAAVEVFERGGYSFLQVIRTHGDEVVETAVRVPGSEAILTKNPEFILGAVRRHGDNALRLEKEVPGFLESASLRLSKADIAVLLKAAPADRRYMARLVKISDSPETAQRLVAEYGSRGPEWLGKLPKRNIIIGGVLTAAFLDHAIRGEESIVDNTLDKLQEFAWMLVRKIGLILLLLVGLPWLTWKILRRRFLRWLQGRRSQDAERLDGSDSLRRKSQG